MSSLKCFKFFLFLSLLISTATVHAQGPFQEYSALFTQPKNYVTKYSSTAPVIDGKLNDAAWENAAWTDLFVDIEGTQKPAPTYATKVKMLWNDSALFIAAHLVEPHIWATLQKKDAIIYYDNDFEVFIDPDNNTHQYYEIEVNAYNTILDLLMPKPYRNGAGAMLGYDVAHLQTAVNLQGTLNQAMDKDSSWTIEMAIPFRSLFIGNYWRAPAEGALWRINFSRVQWQTNIVDGKYEKMKDSNGAHLPENNWVWSPQGVVNMHYPERWGYLLFTKKEDTVFTLPYDENRKPILWFVYYKQQAYRAKHGRYATGLKQLGIQMQDQNVGGKKNRLKLEATSRQFMVYLSDEESTVTINEEGFVQKINKAL